MNNKNLKILTPVKNLLSGIEIIKNGSDEIYFGIVSNDWQKNNGYKTILNRRDGSLANISSFEEASKLIAFAKQKNVKTYITLNNSPLVNKISEIEDEIKKIIKIGADAIIIKDIMVANIIRKIDKNIELHCSSLNQILNKEGVDFWKENFAITRMILPRNISTKEIINICESCPDMEFEIFIKNDWCYNSDGICSSLHLEGLKEGIPYVCNREKNYKCSDEDFNKKYMELHKNNLDCKICILAQLKQLKNLVSIKIVGREKPLQTILNDLKFVKKSTLFLELSDDEKEYIDFNISLHSKIIGKNCGYKGCEYYNNQ